MSTMNKRERPDGRSQQQLYPVALTVTITAGAFALFVPLGPAIASAILYAIIRNKHVAQKKQLLAINLAIVVVNVALTVLAVGVALALLN